MDVPVGIDLGTTNSVVAWCPAEGKAESIPNAHGRKVTPSVVAFEPEGIVVGEIAKEIQASGAATATAFFKRYMDNAEYVFFAAGRDHSVIDLSSYVLAQLKRDAEAHLGRAVRRAVVTVPAYFRNAAREATIEAGRRAGLEVIQVINEPTAAAIAYGASRGGDPRTLLVFDLGGGTFDVTLLRSGGGEIRVLTSTGDHELGGRDWDDCIVRFAASRFEREHGVDPLESPVGGSDLLVRAEECKKQLSVRQSARITLNHAGRSASYEITREKLAELSRPLLERTAMLTERVLDEQRVRPSEVDGVLLVGGATRMPMVVEYVTRVFGRSPMTGVNVDEVVALGAALVASDPSSKAAGDRPRFTLGGRVKITDVTNHSLGAIAINADRTQYINSVILPKNRPIPCVERRPFQFKTRARGRNTIEVFMTQGETEDPADASYLGRYVIDDIPRPARGDVAVIDVEYAYDVSGTVGVRATLRETGAELPVTVHPVPADVPERFARSPAEDLAPRPVSIYLAFDLSGSMSGDPLLRSNAAGKKFLGELDLGCASVGVIAFSDAVRTVAAASQNARTIEGGIDALTVGMTGYGNAAQPFDEALARLQGGDDRKVLVVLTDGCWSNQPHAVARAKACHEAGIDVIAIGFGAADKKFLAQIASGDEASFFTDLGGLSDTFSTIAQVITESSAGLARPDGGGAARSLMKRWLGA